MPTYEYKCEACEHSWEQDQRITEDPIKVCPSCGEVSAKRLISRTAFILMGGGWSGEGYSSGGSSSSL